MGILHLSLDDLDRMSLALFNEVADMLTDDNPSNGTESIRLATQLDMDMF